MRLVLPYDFGDSFQPLRDRTIGDRQTHAGAGTMGARQMRSKRFTLLGPVQVALFVIAALLNGVAVAGTSNSLMDISADGRLLACSNRDNGTVSVVDLATHRKLREVAVGHHPEGVSFLGATHRLAVAVYSDDKVVFLDADSGDVTGETEVFDEPYGIVSSPDGTKLYATLSYPGQLVEIDTGNYQVARSLNAGQYPRGIAISPTENRIYVTEYYTGIVLAIDLESGEQVDRWKGSRSDNLARQITLNPRRPKAYVPHMRSRITATHGAGSIFPLVAIVDTADKKGRRRKRVPMDAFYENLVTSNPWEVAISSDGRQLYVVFAGTNDMFACNVVDDDYTELSLRDYVELGSNPRAVRIAPDDKTLYVYNALDFAVVAYDTSRLKPTATIAVCENPLGEQILLGKKLFYAALQPMVGRRWISCSSCHPDGESDGRTWHNPEGLRDTQALFGLAWTHPVHWSADRDEVQDFEHTIRGQLMQGRGLIQGEMQPQLGPPNRGRSERLDALAAYTNSHRFSLSPHAKNGLSEQAKRGRELFFAKETGCASCHGGPFFTDSVSNQEIVRHDVGTGRDDDTEKMEPAYDTPTLLGIYRTAPYLHHGKARTLDEVFRVYNPNDAHGKTSHLSSQQVSDLVEFLKALPYEDPYQRAEAAQYRRIDD